jgi:hypothetical protein
MAYFDYMMDSTGFANPAMETEEERRARLERERLAAMQAPTAPVKPTPVKETITTDPVTGERKVKIEGSEADLSAMNTRTPTISRPSQQLPPGAVTLPQDLTKPPVQPQTVPMDPTKPPPQMLRVGAEPPVAPVAPETVTPPPPPAATQPAAVAPTPPAAPQPPLGGGLQVRPQQAQAFMPGEIAGMPSMQPPAVAPEYDTLMQGAAVNPRVRNRLITDPNTPADVRRAAIVLERRDLERQREMGAAQKELQQAVQSGNFNALARKIKQETEGGSVLKALFYKSIGMTNLALEEEKKMGAGRKWMSVTDPASGERGFVEYDADGLPISGFDSTGAELSQERLAAFGAGGPMKGVEVEAGTYMDPTGTVKGNWVLERSAGRSVYRQVGTNRVATADEAAALRKTGVQGTLSDQAQRQLQRVNIELSQDWAKASIEAQKAGPVAGNKFIGEFNRKHGTNFSYQDIGGSAPQINLQTGQMIPPQVGAQAPVQQQAGGQAAGGATAGTGGRPATGPQNLRPTDTSGVGGQRGSPAAIERGAAVEQAGDVTRAEESAKSVEKLATAVGETADAASQTAAIARRVRSSVTANPQIAGMLTKRNDKGLDIISAALAFVDQGLGGSEAIEAAFKQMNFNANEVALYDQIKGDLTELSLARARENKGQGTFTDFERRLFTQTIGDIARNPTRAIQYRMEILEYAADKAQRKAVFVEDYLAKNPRARAGQINNAWRTETKKADEAFEKRLNDEYINRKPKVLR